MYFFKYTSVIISYREIITIFNITEIIFIKYTIHTNIKMITKISL